MQRRHKLFSVSPFSPIFLFYAVVALALLGCVAAKPAPVGMRRTTETVYRRQAGDPTKQAVTVQTVQVTNTTLGPVTETCQITLSPAKGHKNLVKEVKQCTYSMGANNAGGGNADSSASASATDSASVTASATDSAASTTDASSTASAASSTDASASSASASSSAAASAASSAATASVAAPAVSANGVSSVPLASVTALAGSSSAAVSSAAVSSAADSSTSAAATAAGAVASDNASATAAPDLASSSASASASPAAAFQIPGKKLSVLPIGLGIFAGISVIALIVVGLVTYERTKYRKAFRQRKLAEQGQSMGYGGMAQQAA